LKHEILRFAHQGFLRFFFWWFLYVVVGRSRARHFQRHFKCKETGSPTNDLFKMSEEYRKPTNSCTKVKMAAAAEARVKETLERSLESMERDHLRPIQVSRLISI